MASREEVEAVLDAYRNAEFYILNRLAGYAKRAGTRQWMESHHALMVRLIGQIETTLTNTAELVNPHLEQVILDSFGEGVAQGTPQGLMVPAVNTRAVQVTVAESVEAITSTHAAILRTVDDIFREVNRTATIRQVITGENRTRRLQNILNEYADRGITCFRDRAGRQWGIDTYAEMALRTGVNRAQNQGRIAGYRANGVRFIRTSSHRGCAPQCLPYQGRILAVDGDAGDSIVTDMVNGGTVTVHAVATLEEALAHGYHHPNCRHTDSPYIPGMPTPELVESDQRDYEVAQKQRYLERGVRHWKRREAAAITPLEKRMAGDKVRIWQARTKQHVRQYGWLTRRYDRERLWVGTAADVAPHHPIRIPSPVVESMAPAGVELRPNNAGPMLKNLFQEITIDGGKFEHLPLKQIRPHYKDVGSMPRTDRTGWEDIVTAANPHYDPTLWEKAQDLWSKAVQAFKNGDMEESARFKMEYERARTEANTMITTWGMNCVRVSNTVELRRRGFDIAAGKYTFNVGNLQNRKQVALVEEISEKAGRKKPTYSNSDAMLTNAWQTIDGKYRLWHGADKARPGLKGGKNAATLADVEEAVPDGATGFATCSWAKSSAGHIWNWEKKDGQIRFFEAQSKRGFIDRNEYLERMSNGTLEMVRVDDLIPTDDIVNVLGNGQVEKRS